MKHNQFIKGLTEKNKEMTSMDTGIGQSYIVFDEVPFHTNDSYNDKVQVQTVYNYMTDYIAEGIDISQIAHYEEKAFILYMNSLKKLFYNRANFVLTNMISDLENTLRSYQIEYLKDKGYIFSSGLYCNSDIIEKLRNIKTYLILYFNHQQFGFNNEMHEILTMEFASDVLGSLNISSNDGNLTPHEVSIIYDEITNLIMGYAETLRQIIISFMYDEPFIRLYMKLLVCYSSINGNIPTELKFD